MIFSRPVNPLATLRAPIAASDPELTRRTISTLGTASLIISANSISPSVGVPKEVPFCTAFSISEVILGSAWPRIIGPQEPM